jgi:hypothetical protein
MHFYKLQTKIHCLCIMISKNTSNMVFLEEKCTAYFKK